MILCFLVSTQTGYANDALPIKDITIFRAVNNNSITIELVDNSVLNVKESGTTSISLDLRKKGTSKEKGADMHYYAIIGVPEFEMMSIADMRGISLTERKKSFGYQSEIAIFIRGVKEADNILIAVELVSGSLSASSSSMDIIPTNPAENIMDEMTSLLRKLDNGFKEETSGIDDFFYNGVSFYTSEKGFMSNDEGAAAKVWDDYSSLAYSLTIEETAKVLYSITGYSHVSFSFENIKENPEHLVYVVKKNGSPIGFCSLRKNDDKYTFRLTEVINASKLEASIKELWSQLDSNPAALQGKFKADEGGTNIYRSNNRLFSAKESNYMMDSGAHFVNSMYTYYSAEALIYLVKRLNIYVSGRKKKMDTANNNSQYYAEIHIKDSGYYGLVIGESDGKVILNLNVEK